MFAAALFSAPWIIAVVEMLAIVCFIAAVCYYILLFLNVPAPFPKFVWAAAFIYILIWFLKGGSPF